MRHTGNLCHSRNASWARTATAAGAGLVAALGLALGGGGTAGAAGLHAVAGPHSAAPAATPPSPTAPTGTAPTGTAPTGTAPTLPADTAPVTVAMQENATLDVIVTASPTVTGAPTYAKGVLATGVTATAKAVRFRKTAGTQTWSVDVGTDCAGGSGPGTPWRQVATGVKNPVARPAATGGELQLCVAGTQSTWDQGTLGGVYNSVGQARTVNTLPLETYVADTAPAESPSPWGTLGSAGPQERPWGFQELEAQAVAVRSYVLADHWSTYAEVCDLYCQDYRGTRYRSANAVAAAAGTAGEVLVMPSGAIALTEYSASSGGWTANATEGSPFTAVSDTGDAVCLAVAGQCNTSHDWQKPVAISAVAGDWPAEGATPTVTVVKRNGLGTFGGRAVTVRISGNHTTQAVTAATFAARLGFPSVWFSTPQSRGTTLVFTGHGHGHGVGMGQWGALGYAVGTDGGKGNFDWRQILARYYQPATLAQLPTSPGAVGAPTGGIAGYWLASTAGGVFTFGNAHTAGSMATRSLNAPVVGMAATTGGGGYWLAAADGGIFSFGDAQFHGSMGGRPLNAPIVGIAADPLTGGYWEVASDGGIFSFTAPFYGSMGGHPLNEPVVGMAAAPTGGGYWEVASDGGIFSFGDTQFHGSMGGKVLNSPMVAIAADPITGGYWTVASDGGVFSFDAPFEGSAAGTAAGAGTVAIVTGSTATGYLTVSAAGTVSGFGDSPQLGSLATADPGSSQGGVVAATATTG